MLDIVDIDDMLDVVDIVNIGNIADFVFAVGIVDIRKNMLAYRKLYVEHMFGILDCSVRIYNWSANINIILYIFYWCY